MTVNSDFLWSVSAKCFSENVIYNKELPLSEDNQVTEKRSDFKKLLLVK